MNRIIPDSVFFMLILGGMSGLLICSAQGNQDANEKHDLEHVNMVKEKCGLLPEDMPDFEDFKMEIVKPDDKEDKPERDDDQKNKKSDKKEESVSGAYTNDLPEADDFKIGLNPSDPDDEKEGKKGGKNGKKAVKKRKRAIRMMKTKTALYPTICLILRILKWKS